MKAIKHHNKWKIQTASHIFFGLIPWTKYLQFCDGAADVVGCSDYIFATELEAKQHIMDIVVRNCCNKHKEN